ncbi:MAG: hypothetical protein ABI972_08190 [Acidobacteriota bacterium]
MAVQLEKYRQDIGEARADWRLLLAGLRMYEQAGKQSEIGVLLLFGDVKRGECSSFYEADAWRLLRGNKFV